MSSTLLLEERGIPFDELQASQIAAFRDTWDAAGWRHEPRVSVSRSVLPVTSDEDRRLFGRGGGSDQVGELEGALSRFGRTYTGEPDRIAEELARDVAVQAADTLLLTVPNQLGVAYNARLLETIAAHVAPAIGWTRTASRQASRAIEGPSVRCPATTCISTARSARCSISTTHAQRPPAVSGIGVALVRDGRIARLYTILTAER